MEHARDFERRRCNHHTLDEPLSEFACIQSVVDPKGTKNNKHKLVVASQDDKLRTLLRGIPGVPLIYIKRSVMVMEPMGGATERVRESDEKSKFRAGLKGARGGSTPGGPSLKRKRDDGDIEAGREDDVQEAPNGFGGTGSDNQEVKTTKKRQKGPKGPNPLSAKKAKAKPTSGGASSNSRTPTDHARDPAITKKRKRRHKAGGTDAPVAQPLVNGEDA